MKFKSRWALGLGLVLIMFGAQPASQLNLGQYALFAGDFNGDGRTDLLYIGRALHARSGIALTDGSGAPQVGFQSWDQTYLGINWSLDYIQPLIGDFNGDGLDDVLLQSNAEDPSYVLLANAKTTTGGIGQLLGISQAIAPTAMGVSWPTRYHKLLAGDFDGDGKDDVLLQAVEPGGTAAMVLTDTHGKLFTRTSNYCWLNGPQQCWTDGELGFDWSTEDSTLVIGDFNADGRADVLVQGWPEFVADETRNPPWIESFRPLSFGVVMSATADTSGRMLRSTNQLWDVQGLGTNWSPLLRNPIVADFNGDGRMKRQPWQARLQTGRRTRCD
jgi:FG-GAP-like repeat